MIWRKVLAGILVVMMTSPVWGGTEPVGSITLSRASTVRDTALATGSTVFSGDAISVGESGATQIALNSGAQAEILAGSLVRIVKTDSRIQMVVDRGQASFHTSEGKDMEAIVADATVRPANSSETSAVIQSLSKTHAVIAAEKGALVFTTAHDGRTYTLREGEAADLIAAPDDQQGSAPAPAGKAAPAVSASKKAVIWTVVLLSGGVAITAYLLARRETKLPPAILGNEISPTKLN